jgi:hypothetical protein
VVCGGRLKGKLPDWRGLVGKGKPVNEPPGASAVPVNRLVKGLPWASVPLTVDVNGKPKPVNKLVTMLPCASVPTSVEVKGSATPDDVKVPWMILVNELPCASVPVEVKKNGSRDGAAAEAPLEDGAIVATIIVENGLPWASVPVLVNEKISAEDCAGWEGAAEEITECADDCEGVRVATTDENVLPCALVPVVVNENTCKGWDDGWAEAGVGDWADWLDGPAEDGARVARIMLVKSDPWLLVPTVVKEKTWVGAEEPIGWEVWAAEEPTDTDAPAVWPLAEDWIGWEVWAAEEALEIDVEAIWLLAEATGDEKAGCEVYVFTLTGVEKVCWDVCALALRQ